ncbi:sensor histidine kinase [Gordonia soli]|uniref:Putative two-component histidine kinase n=1 Tax=Gordonia soli NBRC 108243 TaxID=1223545 RepID=M0QIS3_9ACTN|nr:histidine kinase [Gordonia soli]GAC68443.1 putative two-component histidine kinase [Gordonia soli NBRC 108243]
MTTAVAWWRGLSGPQRYRFYSRVTLQVVVAVVTVVLATAAPKPFAMVGLILGGIAAVLALEAQPEIASLTDARIRRWALPTAVAMLATIWVAAAVLSRVSSIESDVAAARQTGVYIVFLAGISVVPFLRHRWWVLLAVGLVTGAAFGASPRGVLQLVGYTLGIGIVMVATTLLTLWGLRMIDELERAKTVEARLRVAEERLRFSRDLHDVVGRGFSAIAVKSELAGTLLRAGATDRAVDEIDEIKTLAVESMDQMRALVRGYRDIDLTGEVAGARSLLSAAGCRLDVEGDPQQVPARFHEVAAWVVREGTTNIVKHSSASYARLTLGTAAMTLTNDGAADASIPSSGELSSGLRGLDERLGAVGAELDIATAGDTFTLQIRWEKA